jgi:glycosyltransferase involved in cell wall biosynthesis
MIPRFMSNAPELSIIIPTHNRSGLLQQVIATLYEQRFPNERFEVIVCDSASSDDTPQVLQKLAAAHPNFRSVRVNEPGAARARNFGLATATGTWHLLIDDDILVAEGFLQTLFDSMKKYPDSVLLGYIDAPWEDSKDPFLRYLLQAQDVNRFEFPDPSNVSPLHFYTACVAFPRSLLKGLRFDEGFCAYGLEDIDFGMRLLEDGTKKMVYIPGMRVRHEYFPRVADYRRKKFNLGRNLSHFINKSQRHRELFYIEPTGMRYWYRIYRILAAPFAGIAYVYEKMTRKRGPVCGVLYTWFHRDLRIQMFRGMKEHQRNKTSK